MAEEVETIDPHHFDDFFYAYKQLFMNRSFLDICWTNEFFETNFERVSALPIDVVRPYVERMLRVHGSGPLLHTIIAANFECEPMPSNTGRFSFIVNNTINNYTFKKNVMGLLSACGLDKQGAADHSDFNCLRCGVSIKGLGTGIYGSLKQHAMVCEMLIDRRYLEPLEDFWSESDQKAYTNFLHKSLAQTMLTKLGLLILRPKRFDELPFSAFVSNRSDSLYMVLESRRRLRLDDEAMDRIGQAGYHTLYNHRPLPWYELKRSLKNYAQTPVADRKITCFCCYHEVTLSAKFVSDPWRYHAMKSPSCMYLLMKKGSEYVKQIRESMYDLRLRKNKMDRYTAVIDPKLNLRPATTPMGELFDLRKGVMERKKTELRVALSSTKVPTCIVCCNELRTVALMACLHFTTCVDCSFAIRECPFCRMLITGYMMPVYQPDGSFWKQPDCVGGNHFLNLPCCHLIESCVPNNVDRCPKADAVKEDEIYCVVCGDSNLGKLKLYM